MGKNTCNTYKRISDLVDMQVDINRAVWAANLDDLNKSSFKTEAERDLYIESRIKSIKKTVSEL